MLSVLQDVRFGLRQLVRSPLWTIVVVSVLAIGIGANTSMFSGFEAWVLRPLDFEEPDRLVALQATQPKLGRLHGSISPVNLGDWIDAQQSFESIGVFRRHRYNLGDDHDPVRLEGARVTANLFPMLGKQPVLGRTFTPNEDQPGQPGAVALISDRIWRERYGSDPSVIGRTVRLDGRVHQLVGVMEPGFKFPEWAEVWTPFGLDLVGGERSERFVSVFARLRDGISLEAARSELKAIAARLEDEYPDANAGYSADVITLREQFVPPVIRIAITTSLAASLFVLLIICANVASLMLARASARSRESALRTALGASRWRLIRQNVVEGTLLAVPAGLLGVVFGILGVESTLAYVPVEPPYLFHMGFSSTAGIYTFVVALLAGTVCGLVPVLRNSGVRVHEALKTGGRESGASVAQGVRATLVVGELALSTALLIGALLMVKSFIALQAIDPGFRTDGVLTAELSYEGEGFESRAERLATTARLMDALAALPGVDRVGATTAHPASRRNILWGLVAEGQFYEPGEDVDATAHAVYGDYFGTLGIPIVSGRDFTATEKRQGGDVAIISHGLARELWGDDDPLGRRVRLARATDAPWRTVVGVVGDVDIGRDMVSSERPRVQFYHPYGEFAFSPVSVTVQASAPAATIAAGMRDAFRTAAPGAPASEILTMGEAIFRVRWVSRFFSRQLAIYAVIATVIAAMGLYGLMADSVSRRTREMAIRLALGADRSGLIRLVVGDALKLGATGVALGLLLAFGTTGFASQVLLGVDARDSKVFAGVGIVLLAVTVLAAFLPARRASSLDPSEALRAE